MSNPLMESLGLDAVETDPNALPDGKWAGVVFKSEYVTHKAKNSGPDAPKDHISHVITYKVTDGERKGAERQEWYLIAKVLEQDAEGNPTKTEALMTEQQKPWYKKRWVDLGVEEADIPKSHPSVLVGKPIIFGTKKNGAFINISFVELRDVPDPKVASGNVLGSL